MPKRMVIDASHPEETRVVVIDGNRVEEFDFESATKRPLKGNIYLAKVTRVEPSLQAAFVEYGGNRQGFLAFSEIHPDYYQIPVADRMAILQAQTARMMAEDDIESIDSHNGGDQQQSGPENNHDDSHNDEEESDRQSDESERGDDVERSAEQISGPAADEQAPQPQAESFSESARTADHRTAEIGLVSENTGSSIAESGEQLQSAFQSPAEEPLSDVHVVQAEATGAPMAYQRHEHRQGHDRPRPPRRRQYKIQEVIKRRQVMLVQVVKEERGNKGASLTTFLSLAGRYCVLMPNTPRGGGISRKITNAVDRKRLKSAAQSLELPEGMGLIIRTAGANRTKAEIKRDYEYLLRLWDNVRELTLKSNAPALVYEEGSLIKRVIRDLYSKEISEVLVDGEAGYREAKEFMRMLTPSHAKNVKIYREPMPLFQKMGVESQLDAMFSPVVNLRSGGYIVINQTEALVSIDVNSGKATREHSIEDTALKTNLEAADEVARQLRLRDLAGLIVIDFIDMEDGKNDRAVEKRLHNAVRNDRARIQIGRISQFGLLELSRQRLRAGVVAGSTVTCPHCNGQGIVRSTESAALRLLRALDEEGQRQQSVNMTVKTPADVAIYTLNQKRHEIARIEDAYDVGIMFEPQSSMASGTFEIQRTGMRIPAPRPKLAVVSVEGGFNAVEPLETEPEVTIAEPPEAPEQAATASEDSASPDAAGHKRRRRRRGGRGRLDKFANGEQETRATESLPDSAAEPDILQADSAEAEGDDEVESNPTESAEAAGNPEGGERGRRRRRRRGRRGRRSEGELQSPQVSGDETNVIEIAQAREEVRQPSSDLDVEVVSPNTPSSPVWSLIDPHPDQHEPEPRAPEPTNASDLPTEAPTAEPAPEAPERISETVAETAGADEPRETRRGWWQRRFKA